MKKVAQTDKYRERTFAKAGARARGTPDALIDMAMAEVTVQDEGAQELGLRTWKSCACVSATACNPSKYI